MNSIEALKAARALLADQANWTQRAYARGADGAMTGPASPSACRFCAVGAISRVLGVSATCKEVDDVCDLLHKNLVDFNDTHSYADVLALFDKAISEQ